MRRLSDRQATQINILTELAFLISAGDEREILGAPSDRRIRFSPPRCRRSGPAIYAAGRQTFTMNGLDQDPCYFLRKSSVLGGGPAAERLLELTRNVRPDKHTF